MNEKLIPRKYRKHVLQLIKDFKELVAENNEAFSDWNKFLLWQLRGTEDGWLKTDNKEYNALLWVLDMKDLMAHLDNLESDEG